MVFVSLWLMPLHFAMLFTGHLFMQFAYSLAEYFEEMGEEIALKNKQVTCT